MALKQEHLTRSTQYDIRPDEFGALLGSHFVTSQHEIVLSIGKLKYDKFQLGKIGIPQLKAARQLHLVLQRLSVNSPTELVRRLPDLASLKGIGTTTFYAAIAILRSEGWDEFKSYEQAAKNTRVGGKLVVTFDSMKNRAKARGRKDKPKETIDGN